MVIVVDNFVALTFPVKQMQSIPALIVEMMLETGKVTVQMGYYSCANRQW